MTSVVLEGVVEDDDFSGWSSDVSRAVSQVAHPMPLMQPRIGIQRDDRPNRFVPPSGGFMPPVRRMQRSMPMRRRSPWDEPEEELGALSLDDYINATSTLTDSGGVGPVPSVSLKAPATSDSGGGWLDFLTNFSKAANTGADAYVKIQNAKRIASGQPLVPTPGFLDLLGRTQQNSSSGFLSKLPSWVLPVGIGAILLVVVMNSRKSAPAAA